MSLVHLLPHGRCISQTGRALLPRLQRRSYLDAQAHLSHHAECHVPPVSSTAWSSSKKIGEQLRVKSAFVPAGDQSKAIHEILQEFKAFPKEKRFVTLAGATGTGKTFVMAHVIAELKSPALILCHSKVLAQQQYAELTEFLPTAHVRLFESPFSRFLPRSVNGETGELRRRAEMEVDKVASLQRDSALKSLLAETSDSLVMVATVAALFSFSAERHTLTEPEREDVCTKISELADRRLLELKGAGREQARRNLEKIIAADIKKLRKDGTCFSMYEKYGAFLPHRVARTSVVDQLNHRFGCEGWLAIVDESHQMLRAINPMSEARAARLSNLVEWGYQLTTGADKGCFSKQGFLSSLPLKTLLVSATPAPEEQFLAGSRGKIVQMVIRPSSIVDPKIELVAYSLDHLVHELRNVVAASGQVLINFQRHLHAEQLLEQIEDRVPELQGRIGHMKCTLTREARATIMHRFNVSRELSVLVGVGMLAEGLSFPNVNLVIVMDANHGGLFRTEEKLTQFAGRATRNPDARVLFYVKPKASGASLPSALVRCIEKSERRRSIQKVHNDANGNVPRKTVLAQSIGQD
mmetsp:Transcript_10844/g.24578  ORF Transcript_10844/g.24578 Transcript_10844/m.24578 type:complete len:581 (+) Transcript_10844:102-1844(+)